MKRFVSFILTAILCAITCFTVSCTTQENNGNAPPPIDTSITETTPVPNQQAETEKEAEQQAETEKETEQKKYICPRCGECEVRLRRSDYPFICGACGSLFVFINGEFKWVGNAV